VVPAFGLLDAVSKGTLDGGHGVLVYSYGKQNALALWGSGPAFGMDAQQLLSWHKYGGGKELLAKLYASIGGNVVSYPYGRCSRSRWAGSRNRSRRSASSRA
jgi:TRAP-type mannitol/chloroaromatic compound transport system substrate-binding protein